MTEIAEPSNDFQYERMQKVIYEFLRGCPHHHELQLSPRMQKLKAAFLKYGTNRLIDLEPHDYSAFEADLQRLVLEEKPAPEFDNSHMGSV